MSSHRRPKMPKSFSNPVRGQCRWCSEPVLDGKGKQVNRQRCWHPECAKIYRIACFSGDQRSAVFGRDKGICARCGLDTAKQALIIHETNRLDAWLIRAEQGRIFGDCFQQRRDGTERAARDWLFKAREEIRCYRGFPPYAQHYPQASRGSPCR